MDAEHPKNVIFEKVLLIVKSNSSPEDDVTEKWKVEAIELIFYVVFKKVIVFDAAPWESVVLTNLFKKSKRNIWE